MDIENFLAQIPSEDQQSVEEPEEKKGSEEKETTPDSPPEKNQTEESPSPEGEKEPKPPSNTQDESKLPFHKQSRWIERENQWKNKLSEYEKRLAAYEQSLNEVKERPSNNANPTQLPERFVRLYGDNPEAYQLYQQEMRDWAKQVKEDLKLEQQRQEEQKQTVLKESNEYIESSLSSLEEFVTSQGQSFDRNEFMKFMVDLKEKYGVLPSDEEDNIDFSKGFSLFQDMKQEKAAEQKAKSSARKELADFTSSSTKTKSDSKSRDYLTSQDLRKMDWDDLTTL